MAGHSLLDAVRRSDDVALALSGFSCGRRDWLIRNSPNCRLLGACSVPGDILISEKECRILPGRWLGAGLWSPGSGWSRA